MLKREHSIKNRLLIWNSLLIIIIITVLVGFIYLVSKDLALENGISHIESMAHENKLMIEQNFNEAYDLTQSIATTVLTVKNDDQITNKREVVEEIVASLLAENPDIIGVNVGFEPNAFDQRDAEYIGNEKYDETGRFIPYISYEKSVLSIVPIENMETSEFYMSPKNNGKATITEPYNYTVQGKEVLMTTIVMPIYDGKNFIGIIGVDIPIDHIQGIITDHADMNGMHMDGTVLSNQGMIVADNNEEHNGAQYSPVEHEGHDDFQTIASAGIVSEFMADGDYEVNLPITIKDMETQWYLFTHVHREYLLDQTLKTTMMIALLAIAFTLMALIILFFIIKKTIHPITSFSKTLEDFDAEDIDNSLNVEDSHIREVNVLATAYSNILENLKLNFKLRDRKDKLQMAQVGISELIQGSDSLQELSNGIIQFVTKEVNGQIGVLYMLKGTSGEETYELQASYAYKRRKGMPASYKKGEGLIGQAALEKELIIVSDIPEDYISVNSGTGSAVPKNVVLMPCEFNHDVIAVLEIGLLSEVSDLSLEYLENIKSSIAVALNNVRNNENVKALLLQTTEQSEQLQVQQEELRVTNEELEEQTEILRNSETELKAQQEELRVINEELEENTRQMELRKDDLEKKNILLSQAQEEVMKKASDLELSNKYKTEFLANMSHELRTPLNSILILSELLSENDKNNLSDKEVEFARTIHTSGNDLLNLINDILDLSKVEAGKTDINIKEMNLEEFRADMTSLFSPLAAKNGVDFNVHVSEQLPRHVMTDEQKVKQIVKNLLSNAFKFTEQGSVSLNVGLSDKKVSFEVVDTGIGIEDNKMETIFEAFKQEDGSISRKFGGTGLGLSISREYATLLGGELNVKSEKNEGSAFNLVLPMAYQVKAEQDFEKTVAKEISTHIMDEINGQDGERKIINKPEDVLYIPDDRNTISTSDKSILIVDDDVKFAEILMELVEAKGYKTIVADSGENALYLADLYQPTGIILDIGLPGIDGWEVMNRLKKNKRTKNIPVYFLSGNEKEAGRSLEGALRYYTKPISSQQIDEILLETSIFNSTPQRVLVVEDNDIQRNSVIELIKRNYKDLKVDSSESGKEALDKLGKLDYDLIILDLELNDYRRFEFVEELKANDEFKDIPVIIYTGQDITGSEEKALRNKVNDIIIKGEKSFNRLLDEIRLFVHKVDDLNRVSDQSKSENLEIFTNKTVLVVDDDMRNIFALSSILETNGIEVEVATNGKEALAKLSEENTIDLVLMDIMMPEMDGYEAIEEVRKMKAYQKLPIIALTAKAMKGDRDKCIQVGANEYLSKPVDKNKLLSLLRVWMT